MMMTISLRIAKVQGGILAYEAREKTLTKPTRRDLRRNLEEKYMRRLRFRGYGENGWES